MSRRPPGDKAMTGAERQRKRRERLRQQRLADEIPGEGEAEYAARQERLWKETLAAKAKYEALCKALGGETKKRERLVRGARYDVAAKQAYRDSDPAAQAQVEIARLRQPIHNLGAARARREAANKAAQTKAAKPPPDPGSEDSRIARLPKDKELHAELRHMRDYYAALSEHMGLLIFEPASLALPPDTKPSEANRAEAQGVLGVEGDGDKAKRR